jgi:nucleoside-diphosphate-sugar epimerase
LLNKNIKPIYGERKPGDIKHSFANINLITKKLGYEPKVSFKEGLKRTVEFYSRL